MAEIIDSDFEMLLVPIIPNRFAEIDFCYRNVEAKVKKEGGSVQYGWFVVQSPFMVEALHHAVWTSPNGDLIDITPSRIQLNNALFIPDDRITFDGGVIDNIRINITDMAWSMITYNPILSETFSLRRVPKLLKAKG